MTDAIDQEIIGEPVHVTIAGVTCTLRFPLHALFLYKRLTGDSLFRFDNWKKIDFEESYENWMACLWAGIHEALPDGTWKAPLTRPELEQAIGFPNAAGIHRKMVEALTAWMPKEKKSGEEEQRPTPERPPAQTSDSTGSAPAASSEFPGEAF